jgi:hypothetical protein
MCREAEGLVRGNMTLIEGPWSNRVKNELNIEIIGVDVQRGW